MAETLNQELLSGGAATGGWLTITDTATLGETVHTAHATAEDRIWLWAACSGSTGEKLTLEWGSASDISTHWIEPDAGFQLVSPGLPMTGSDVLTAFASTASNVLVHGYVIRVTSS